MRYKLVSDRYFMKRFWHFQALNRVGIRNSTDYSPFGVELDGRTVSLEGYRFGFQNQEKDDEIKGEGNSINYTFRMHDPRLGRFFAIDPLTTLYPHNSTYAFCENRVINSVELEGLEAYLVIFPDYIIQVGNKKVGGLGHAGSLIINPTTGDAYYVEYGRYDKESKGITRNLPQGHKVGTVTFGEDGLPTEESLSKVFKVISEQAGHGGRIEAAEVPINEEEFKKMKEYQETMLGEKDDPNRKNYDLLGYNCGTRACEIITENKEDSGIPESPNVRPVKMVKQVQENTTRIGYNPNTGSTTRGGVYIPSEVEKQTDEEIKKHENNQE